MLIARVSPGLLVYTQPERADTRNTCVILRDATSIFPIYRADTNRKGETSLLSKAHYIDFVVVVVVYAKEYNPWVFSASLTTNCQLREYRARDQRIAFRDGEYTDVNSQGITA